MNLRRLFVCALVAWAGIVQGGASTAASEPGPTPLRVSDNGRTLVDATGRPVFLLADTAWSLAMRLKRDEAEAYLRQRRAQRFNTVAFVLFTPWNPEITEGLKNAYGAEPFRSVGGRADPAQPLLTPGADPADPAQYDFWDHVDYLVALTRRLGLYAIVLPTWGNAVTGSVNGRILTQVMFDEANARAYGRWLGRRYRSEPHVIWMLGGDRAAVEGPQDGRPVYRAMAEGLLAGGPGKLLSYHPRKGGAQSGVHFHGDPWLAFNSIQEWPDVQVTRMAEDWARTPPKPTWIFEGRYEGYWKNNYKPEDWGEWQIRQQAYQTVLGGAFGHTYGHERVFGFGKDGANWRDFMDTPGARSMTQLAKLMNGLASADLLDRVPDQSLFDGDEGKAERLRSNRITAARMAGGRLAIFYTANGRPVRVRMERLAALSYSAAWFNPRTGGWFTNGAEASEWAWFARDLAGGPGAAPREFVPPTNGAGYDWLLILSVDENL